MNQRRGERRRTGKVSTRKFAGCSFTSGVDEKDGSGSLCGFGQLRHELVAGDDLDRFSLETFGKVLRGLPA